MGFRPIGLCVLTVWASIRDPAFIRTQTSEPPAFIRDWHLFETRRLIDIIRCLR